MIVYHIDRGQYLHSGQRLNLVRSETNFSALQSKYVKSLFQDEGISHFGRLRTRDNRNHKGSMDHWVTETIFEYVRQLHFPNELSRFQCFFSSLSIEIAMKWIDWLDPSGRDPWVWETEVASIVERDSAWLGHGIEHGIFSPDLLFDNAYRYWDRKTTSSPRLEAVSPFPVAVLRRIE